jgi:tetratricopeptide (TPR) repeat protein
LREVRIGIYGHDIQYIEQQFEDYYKYGFPSDKITLGEVFLNVCNNPFNPKWFRTLPSQLFDSALASIVQNASLSLFPADDAFALMQEGCTEAECPDLLRFLLTEQCLLRGKLQAAQESLQQISPQFRDSSAAYLGWLNVLLGNYEEAIQNFTIALQALKKLTGKRKVYFDDAAGLFFVLALLKQGSPERLREAEEYTNLILKQPAHWLGDTYKLLRGVLQIQQGNLGVKEALLKTNMPLIEVGHSLEVLLCALCLYWVDAEVAKTRLPMVLEPFLQQAEESNYDWLAMESAELLSRIKPRGPYGKKAATLSQAQGATPLANLIQPKEAWELCLNALAGLQSSPQPAPAGATLRLIWSITLMGEHWEIQPREQKINAKGGWSKGRNVAIKRQVAKVQGILAT